METRFVENPTDRVCRVDAELCDYSMCQICAKPFIKRTLNEAK